MSISSLVMIKRISRTIFLKYRNHLPTIIYKTQSYASLYITSQFGLVIFDFRQKEMEYLHHNGQSLCFSKLNLLELL